MMRTYLSLHKTNPSHLLMALHPKNYISAKNTCQFTSQEIQNIQQDHEAQQLIQVREKEELVTKKKEELTLSS